MFKNGSTVHPRSIWYPLGTQISPVIPAMYPVVLIFPFCGPQSSKVCLLTSSCYICFVFLGLIQDLCPFWVFLFSPGMASVLCACLPISHSGSFPFLRLPFSPWEGFSIVLSPQPLQVSTSLREQDGSRCSEHVCDRGWNPGHSNPGVRRFFSPVAFSADKNLLLVSQRYTEGL